MNSIIRLPFYGSALSIFVSFFFFSLNVQAVEIDSSFQIPSFENNGGSTNAIVVEPNGQAVAVGEFTSWDAVNRSNIVRLRINGEIDTSFSPEVNDAIYVIERLSSGKYYIAGKFSEVNGIQRPGVARLNNDGSLDTSFDPQIFSPRSGLTDLKILNNGDLLLVSDSFLVNGEITSLIKLSSNGTLDTNFGLLTPDNNLSEVLKCEVLENGKILIAGAFSSINGHTSPSIARLEANGTVDTSFVSVLTDNNSAFTTRVEDLLINSDEKIIVSGFFTIADEQNINILTRLNQDGTLDTSFPSSVNSGSVQSLMFDNNNRLIVGGFFNEVNGVEMRNSTLVRFNTDGSLDDNFSPDILDTEIHAIANSNDNKLIVGGQRRPESFSGAPNTSGRTIRILDNGNLDSGFLNKGIMTARDGSDGGRRANLAVVAEDRRGRLLVGGGFARVSGVSAFNLVRLNADGNLDQTFSHNITSEVREIVALPNGQILVRQRSPGSILRLNSDGSQDLNFGVNGSVLGSFNSMATQADGKIIVSRSTDLIRLNSDGTQDLTFNFDDSNITSTVISISFDIQDNQKILVAVNFVRGGGSLFRLNQEGSLDTSFQQPVFPANIRFSRVSFSQRHGIIVTGNFTTVNSQSISDIVVLNEQGAISDTQFPLINRLGYRFDVQCDDRIVLFGRFTSIGNQNRSFLARLNPDLTVDSNFILDATENLSGFQDPRLIVLSDGRILLYGTRSAEPAYLAAFIDEENQEAACYQSNDELCVIIPKKVTFCL